MADSLLKNAVARRKSDGMTLAEAVKQTAADLELEPDRVMRAYLDATNSNQEEVIAFLKRDHGRPQGFGSVMATHPLYEFFDLRPGDYLIAKFADGAWIIWRDGSYASVERFFRSGQIR